MMAKTKSEARDERSDTALALVAQDVKYIQRDVMEIKSKLDQDYVSRAEFEPIKKIIYGLISLILVAVVGAVISLVVRK
jgi:hypothetical protein